jgi:rubrerythrin
MNGKPSYLGLLNAISNGETRAAGYFKAWLDLTADPAVRSVLQIVVNREAEHGLAFEKRILELGYSLIERPNPEADEKLAVLSDPSRTDLEKILYLGYGEPRDDPFGRLFEDHSIDAQTGALLGRYIAEERDTIRRLRMLAETLNNHPAQKVA